MNNTDFNTPLNINMFAKAKETEAQLNLLNAKLNSLLWVCALTLPLIFLGFQWLFQIITNK